MADFGARVQSDRGTTSRCHAEWPVVRVGLLEATWGYLDGVAATAPASLRRGPRGGGRGRAAILDHGRDAERAYSPKVGCRVPPQTPWPEQRSMLAAARRAWRTGTAWPARYVIRHGVIRHGVIRHGVIRHGVIRRCGWPVLDHAWDMEDRSEWGQALLPAHATDGITVTGANDTVASSSAGTVLTSELDMVTP